MTCAELRDLAPLWAAGALSPEEIAACEAHLEAPTHDGCIEALALANDAAVLLVDSLGPARPPPHVWAAIAAGLGPERELASPPRAVVASRERLAWAVAAAAVLALGLQIRARAALTTELRELSDQRAAAEEAHGADVRTLTDVRAARDACTHDLQRVSGLLSAREEALALLEAPETAVVPLAAQQGKSRATALVNVAERRAVVVASALEAHPDGDYELWLIRGDRKIAAGLLKPNARGDALASLDSSLFAEGAPDAVAVTLEASGGGDQPKGPIVLVGALPKT